jgi:predicted ribosomally synthesized peptide with nif11-like leader
MSTVQAEMFLDRLADDPEFADRLASNTHDPHMVFAMVTEMGFDATPDEIRDAFFERNMRELTEEQLAAIAGGISDAQIATAVIFSGLTVAVTASVAAAAA